VIHSPGNGSADCEALYSPLTLEDAEVPREVEVDVFVVVMGTRVGVVVGCGGQARVKQLSDVRSVSLLWAAVSR